MKFDSNFSLKSAKNEDIHTLPGIQNLSNAAVNTLDIATLPLDVEAADILAGRDPTDLQTEHQRVLQSRVPNIEKPLADSDKAAALWQACEHGNLPQARALIRDGADASRVLLRKLAIYPSSVTELHGKALNSLITVGADVDTALAYAIAENHAITNNHNVEASQIATVQTLLVLGANGTAQLNLALANHDQQTVSLLLHAGVPTEKLLIDRAMHTDAASVAMLHAGTPGTKTFVYPTIHDNTQVTAIRDAMPNDMTSAIVELAQQGHQHAIELLITTGIDTSLAMLQLLKAADDRAVRLLIASGAPTENLMTYLSLKHGLIHHNGITLLSRLICAGADPSAMLCEAARKPQDLARAEILSLAGATVSSALKHASPGEMESLRKTLFLSWGKVSLIKTQVLQANKTESADIEIVEKILSALNYAEQPEADSVASAMKGNAAALMSKGDYEVAELLLALESTDWAAIKKRSSHIDVASKAVRYAAISEHLPALRLLKAAGALMVYAAEDAIARKDTNALRLLITAGWSPHCVLTFVVTHGDTQLAKQLIGELTTDRLQVLHGIYVDFGMDMLQRFIPAIIDGCRELLAACSSGDVDFAKTLVAAGVNPSATLLLAVSESKSSAITLLLSLGADPSDAATHALATGYKRASQLLFALG